MAPVAIAMASGIVLDRFAGPWGTATWAGIALVASAVALLAGRREWAGIPSLVVAIAAIGGAWHHWRWSDRAADDLSRFTSTEPRPAWLRGTVRTVPEHRESPVAVDRPGDEGYTRFELEITAASDGDSWRPASGRAIVTAGGDRTDLRAGDPIEAAGALALIAGPLNPGERDPRDYPRSQGIRLRFSVDDPGGLALDPGGRGDHGRRWLGRVRESSGRRLGVLLGDRAEPTASALLLGRRGGIDVETSDAFSCTGTAHLLAISGLNLSAMAGALGVAATVAGLRHKGAAGLILVAVVGYAMVVGLSPSVGRATAMVVAVCLAAIVDRPSRLANTIALAAVITMMINPSDLFAAGWQLSFLAVAVLAFGVPPLLGRLDRWWFRLGPDADPLDVLERRLEPRWKRVARRVALWPVAAVATSAAVWLACLPLVAWRFNVVAPIGILLNLPMIPMVSLAVVVGGLALVLSTLWLPMAAPAAWACDTLLRWTLWLVEWGESVPGGHAFVPTPPTGWIIGVYAMFALAARASSSQWPMPARRGAWLGVAAVGAVAVALTMTPHRPTSHEVEVLAVGHGLSTVIQGPDGSATLYDCGRSGDPGVGRRIAAPALWARGVRRLETIVISHADSDHFNGIPDLLDRFAVGRLVVPEGFGAAGNPGAARVIEEARQRGIPIVGASAGDRVELVTGLDAIALHPPRGWLPGAPDNDRSLVLDLAIDGRHLLLTGDLDGAGLAEVIASPRPGVDAMLAPHHGGRSSNPPWLYDWAAPGVVIASQRAPRPGSADALEGLDRRGIAVHRTWRDGAVLVHWQSPNPAAPETLAGWVVGGRGAGPSPDEPGRIGRTVAASIGFEVPPAASRWLAAIVGLVLGAWLCAAMAVMHWGAWALVLPGRGAGQAAPLPRPWRSVSIVARDGVRLRGWWLDARGDDGEGGSTADAPGRVALVLHGMAEASPGMRGRGEALQRAGWSVLLPDLRAFGRSEGDRASFGAREADDLRAWIDAVTSDRPGATVAVWGRSMGAAVALRAATEDARIASLVLEAPYADLRQTLAARLGRLRLPGAAMLTGAVLSRASRLAGARLDRPRPTELAARVAVPALILHGEADPIAPMAEARRLADAFPDDRRPEIASIPGAGHADVFDRGGPALADRVAAFIDSAAPPRPST